MNRLRLLGIVLVALATGVTGLAWAAPPPADTPLAPERVRQAVEDRNYPEALKAIDEAAKANQASADYLAYLKGWTLYLAKQYDPALAALEQMEKAYPQSPWLRRARFARAVALARKGDFRSAELIYRAEAERLLSADRKQELAEIYLEYADRWFRPAKDDQKPEYQKALAFYEKALQIGPSAARRPEIELRVAQCEQQLGKIKEAAARYEKFSHAYAQSPLDVEARFRLGECWMTQGNLIEARRVWQDLLAAYPQSTSERVAEAAFLLSRTWKLPQPADKESLSLGVAALEAFLVRFPADKRAGEAWLNIAQSYSHRGRHDDAAKVLERFLKDARPAKGDSPPLPERPEGFAQRGTVPLFREVAEARWLLGRSYQLQSKFPEALAASRDYLAKHPNHDKWSAAQEQIVTTEYQIGLEKFRAKKFDEAQRLWTEFMTAHPLDGHNPGILAKFGWMSYHQKQWDAALGHWRRLVSKYPTSEEASAARWLIATTLEDPLGKLEEALEAYRKVQSGRYAGEAVQAVARLTSKSMTIATQRAFRSDETPRVRLTTRNLESVNVRVYKVDLETYFRKMHRAVGVEQLNVALIDPDATFEFRVPKYAKYQQLENDVEVPLPGGLRAGVMAVTVSSPTLEATTMVLQSDLEVVVKTSRDELFVFAENLRTGKPWPGVRLLASNGRQVFAEATTGERGVFQGTFKELNGPQDVRVFAVSDGNVASSAVGLEGLTVARGLSDKGYLYTDRPAYQPGELVQVRGCIRLVSGDVYAVPGKGDSPHLPERPEGCFAQMGTVPFSRPKQGKLALRVLTSNNRPLWTEDVRLGEFGTFHAQFTLPRTSPQGSYRLVAQDADGRTFQGVFQVEPYRLAPVRLTVDTPRRVYYRGEEIEGTIRASFYYGAPLAGREIAYTVNQQTFHERTDAKGEVRFKLPTRDYQETQTLPMAVTLPEQNLSTTVNFVLAQQGFWVDLSTVRPVFLAGETFEVTTKVRDAEGRPLAQKLTLRVLELTTLDGKVGERPVEQHQLATAAADGLARQTLKLGKGGRYVLRAEGIDRFTSAVAGTMEVQISGDEDETRLRILADQHTFRVGDTARVRVVWRESPALALVTHQGAQVLGYELVELGRGENVLSVPMTAALAPNFELSVAVMTDGRAPQAKPEAKPQAAVGAKPQAEAGVKLPALGAGLPTAALGAGLPTSPKALGAGLPTSPKPEAMEQPAVRREAVRFHHVSSPFAVVRDLKVELSVRRKDGAAGPIRPGDEVAVTLATTDPQGRPAPAELSLTMVEQSLLEKFAWPVPSIQEFFYGLRREPAVRTESSITFAYYPATQPINPRLLAERERRQLAEEEAASRVAGKTADFNSDIGLISGAFGGGGRGRVRGAGGMGGGMGGMGGMMGAVPQANQPVADDVGKDPFTPDIAADSDDLFEPPSAAAAQGEAGTAEESVGASRLAAISKRVATAERWSDKARQSRPENLAAARETPEPAFDARVQRLAQQAGYWNPAIVTGKDGQATVVLRMPGESTAWTFLAKGITVETLAGEASLPLAVKKDLFGQLKLPLAFTDGDEAQIGVLVHNDAVAKGPIDVTLRTTIAGRTVAEKKTIEVTTKGIEELAFKTALRLPEPAPQDKAAPRGSPGEVVFELTVSAGDRQDRLFRTVALRPYGMPVFRTASGSAASDTTVWVEAPKDMPLASPSLQILLGPTVERSLIDVIAAPAPWCQQESDRIASGVETATSDLMAALGLAKLLGVTREAGGPQARDIDVRIRASLGLLISAQAGDGGWSWTGRAQDSDRYSSARAVWAFSLARAAGYAVPDDAFQKAVAYLREQLSVTDTADYESKAILLHALATAGQGDFALANHLYRERLALSPAAMLHLALAFAEMDRGATTIELLERVSKRDLDNAAPRRTAADGSLPWSNSPVELRALYSLALERASPQAPKAKELIEWLLAHRTGHRWSPDKATGPAALAACTWFAGARSDAERYRLTVFVNDVQVQTLDVDPAEGTRSIDVPPGLLKPGKQRINFQLAGRGRYTYQCILGGFVPADKLASTTTQWSVQRTYEPAPLEMDGRPIPRGFKLATGTHAEFRNPLGQLGLGGRGIVELRVKRADVTQQTPEEQLEYLVITEPIPAGAGVIDGSVRGGFDRFEIGPGAITFYVGSRRQVAPIHYELHGYLPGAYRIAPTVIRNAYRPEQLAAARPHALAVLARGLASSDPYRLTPDELYELGKRLMAQGRKKEAGAHLAELTEKWNLPEEAYKEVVGWLLDIHLELGPSAKVVQWFEVIKEKWPDQEIPFAQILKVGAAYHEMGEYERSYLIFRATVEGNFLRESGVAGFLDEQGEFIRSVEVMGRLLRQYPPEPYLAAAQFALSERVHAKAPEAAGDPKLRQQKVNRVDLVRRAWRMLQTLLTEFPEDPAADQAAFAAANALLELKDFRQAADACNAYARRYPKSELLDSFWYIIGYCQFAAGQHKEAIQRCQQVVDAQLPDPRSGRPRESANKWRAVYILGQIYHALGQPADAVREYRRVEDRFSDAKRSIDYFLRKAIELPEVTTVRPGQPVEVELKFRNLAACDVKVYRVDLMKFGLFERSLGGIAGINLAGIRPQHEAAVALGDGKDYRDRAHKLPLPVKQEGAYLVVSRGENLHASGLVLVTPLALDVQADAAGQVRTTVKDAQGRYLANVDVRVIGSGNQDFVSGATDLRGVFVAEKIRGAVTVMAQQPPSRYAFFRSPGAQRARPGPEVVTEEMPRPRRAPRAGQSVGWDERSESHQPVDTAKPRWDSQSSSHPTTATNEPVSLLGSASSEEAEERIRAALDSPTQCEFMETPLADVLDFFKDRHKIEIQIDTKCLNDVGVAPDTPVTRNLSGVTLRSALKLILKEMELTYTIDNEVLLITSPESADQRLKTVVYPVEDLVTVRDASGEEDRDYDSLIDLMTSTVRPTTWDSVGGPGSIGPLDSKKVIVISQTDEVHSEIQEFLANVRKIGTKPGEARPTTRAPAAGAARGERSGGRSGGAMGFGGGMGGMGGQPAAKPRRAPSKPAANAGVFAEEDAAARTTAAAAQREDGGDLLSGVHEANQRRQKKQVEKLKGMYQKGMGGMGGGIGAGAAY